MQYRWDEDKNRRNIERRGIAFEDAKRIFEGPTLERIDDRFDDLDAHPTDAAFWQTAKIVMPCPKSTIT